MKYFKELTSKTTDPSKKNAVIMGRKTWESIPDKFRPLPGRVNFILSRSATSPLTNDTTTTTPSPSAPVRLTSSLDNALAMLAGPEFKDSIETVFVIGGGQVYTEALTSPLLTAVHLTLVEEAESGAPVECDTFMPGVDEGAFKLWSAGAPRRKDNLKYSFLCYTHTGSNNDKNNNKNSNSAYGIENKENGVATDSAAAPPSSSSSKVATEGPSAVLPPGLAVPHEEQQYLNLIAEVMDEGIYRGDRTGTGTLSKFGATMRFNLRHSFPVLTTKRVFWRGVAEELLWFVNGCTNAKVLQDKGVHIWDGNGSKEYLESIGLGHRQEMDLGPVYGFQWRHFGAEYTNMHADYSNKGVDQLTELIYKIKTNPTDRRLVLTAWNPAALPDMALPPCHMFCQFYVADGELSCQMYQRSCDLGLGVPFNIASYALLTRMVAQVCGLKAGDFVHVLGDAHVYSNHVDPLKEQLKNVPKHFPILKINPAKTDIDSFTFDDFELVGYAPHKKIVMQMAV
jgi:dihydrofolate reductase/thymidylate synthase